MDILRMLEQLNDLAVEQPKTYIGVTFGLNKEEIAMQIAKIRASLPNELKAAAVTMRESERIVGTAREDATTAITNSKKESERVLAETRQMADKLQVEARQEADRIVEIARLQQERMVAESEVLKLAKAQAEEIRNSADRDAVQMRRGADKYAYDMLSQLEGVVGKVMTAIERGKGEIQKPETAVVNAAARERSRV